MLPFSSWFGRLLCLGISLFLVSFTVLAQQIKPDLYREIFKPVNYQPKYPGGSQAMRKYLDKNLRYPDLAAKSTVSGKVYVLFVVEADGQLTQIELLKGLGFGCDEEAIRLIKAMPRWMPGKISGRPQRAQVHLPILFGPK